MGPYLGRLYQPNTDYPAMDLWKPEAAPSRDRVLCVTGLEPDCGIQEVTELCQSLGVQQFRVQVSRRRSVAYVQLNGMDRQRTTRGAMQDLLAAGGELLLTRQCCDKSEIKIENDEIKE
jgi:hypothetical protein